jgi:hypothetical protein
MPLESYQFIYVMTDGTLKFRSLLNTNLIGLRVNYSISELIFDDFFKNLSQATYNKKDKMLRFFKASDCQGVKAALR